MKFADIIFKKVNRFMEIFLVLIFGLLVLDVLWQVFSRYVLNTSFSWTEELARFSLIWLSILGAAYLNARRDFNIPFCINCDGYWWFKFSIHHVTFRPTFRHFKNSSRLYLCHYAF